MKTGFFRQNLDFFRQALPCLFLAVTLTTCFNPLDYNSGGDNGLIRVALPGAGPAKTSITPGNLSYELIFSGPGGQNISRTAAWGETCVVEVPPGAWAVTVWAKDGSDIKAFGTTAVDVTAGSQNNADVKLAVYTEVNSWAELQSAITTNTNGNDGLADELIVIKSSFSVPSGPTITLADNKTVTIVADGIRSITRSGFTGLLIDINESTGGAELILGSSAYTGELTFDGDNLATTTSELIQVFSGKLTMNDRTTLTQNTRGAVNCRAAGTFVMNGGKITGNSTGSGAGVYTTGQFIMNGGVIGGSGGDNSASYGGGVYVVTGSGEFTMNGGEISYNAASVQGGGVIIADPAVFTMNGGVIKNNTAATGAGVSSNGTFNIRGGALVVDNDVDNDVYLPSSTNTITVTGPLTQTPAAKVTLHSSFVAGTQVLTSPAPDTSWFAGKIAFTDTAHSLNPDGTLSVGPTTVTDLSLTSTFAAPTIGGIPASSLTGTQYTGNITWSPNHTTFAIATPYTATVTLTADAGYTFAGVAATSFYHGTIYATGSAGTGTTLTVTIAFPATDFVTPGTHREMVTVPGVTSKTGTATDGMFKTGRTVTISAFKMAKYEVTWQLWKEVHDWATSSARGANIYTFTSTGQQGAGGSLSNWTAEEKIKLPVTLIYWNDAIVWCNAYSEMSGKTPVYTNGGSIIRTASSTAFNTIDSLDITKNGYRLPTETEWEYAARGGDGSSTWGTKYSGSDTISAVAVYDLSTPNQPHPVGTKTANPPVLYDMSGNVWEYCWDRYGSIESGTFTNPTGPTSGTQRVRRGGSYNSSEDLYSNPGECNVIHHGTQEAIPYNHRNATDGFRVVCKD